MPTPNGSETTLLSRGSGQTDSDILGLVLARLTALEKGLPSKGGGTDHSGRDKRKRPQPGDPGFYEPTVGGNPKNPKMCSRGSCRKGDKCHMNHSEKKK